MNLEASQLTATLEPTAMVLPAATAPLLPRRLRDCERRRFVACQHYLVCGRSLSRAHHLRFVQPCALGLKLSDEWVVPLFRIHHRALHIGGNEPQWWAGHDIDPITEALKHWENAGMFLPRIVSPAMMEPICKLPIACLSRGCRDLTFR